MIADATSLISGIRARIPRGWWWKAAIAASVPWPSASGAKRNTMIPEIRPPSATMSGIASGQAASVIGAPPSPAGDGGRVAGEHAQEQRVARSRAVVNRIAPSPPMTPMSAPSTTHLRR